MDTLDNNKVQVQLFPHADGSIMLNNQPFLFTPVELELEPGRIYKLGRKVDKQKPGSKNMSRDERSSNNVQVTHDDPSVTFRSKVVSRSHGEIWVDKQGQVYFKDIGSSSGSFLNRLRLSPSGKESRPYPLKAGDVVQLGVDYQGRQEEIYKAVLLKVFITRQKPPTVKANRKRYSCLI